MDTEKGDLILSQDQIDQCIAILKILNQDTNQIFEIPKDKRIALLIEAGRLSRPIKEELSRRKKDGRKAAKRKAFDKDKQARRETGIRIARDASVFVAPKMISLTGAKEKSGEKLASPRNCISIYKILIIQLIFCFLLLVLGK